MEKHVAATEKMKCNVYAVIQSKNCVSLIGLNNFLFSFILEANNWVIPPQKPKESKWGKAQGIFAVVDRCHQPSTLHWFPFLQETSIISDVTQSIRQNKGINMDVVLLSWKLHFLYISYILLFFRHVLLWIISKGF